MAWSFSDKASAEELLDEIEEGKITNSATAYSICTSIMNTFSGSELADRAERIRDSL